MNNMIRVLQYKIPAILSHSRLRAEDFLHGNVFLIKRVPVRIKAAAATARSAKPTITVISTTVFIESRPWPAQEEKSELLL